MPLDNNYLQYSKIIDSGKKYQFHVGKISGTQDLHIQANNLEISFNNLDILGNTNVIGNISANKFYGDGSNLTGIASGGGSNSVISIVESTNLISVDLSAGLLLTSDAENNIILGKDCGNGITTSNNNTLIGNNIMKLGNGQRNVLFGENIGLQTTGNYNIVLGNNIGNNISEGILSSYNVMIGHNIGGGRIVGSSNVFIGKEVSKNSGGASINNSVMIGRQAGSDCTTSSNVFVGYSAGQVNVNGSHNTSLGIKAGTSNNSNNTVNIGNEAGRTRTTGQDHAICIGAQTGNFGSGEHSIQIGYRANYNTPSQHKRVIVINATGSALESTQSDTFKVKPIRNATGLANALFYDSSTGEITYDIAPESVNLNNFSDASFGNVDISGNLYVNSDISANKYYGDGSNLTGIASGGTSVDNNNNIISNTVGTGNPTGTNNIFLGQNAGSLNNNSSTSGDIFIGYNAGQTKSTNNSNNIVIGTGAASSISKLENNIVIGNDALFNITQTGYVNNGLIIGNKAGGNRFNKSIIIGTEADYTNDRQDNGICIGYRAGYNSWSNTSVVIGSNANSNTGGTNYLKYNVIIGYYAADKRVTIGSVAIGYESQKCTSLVNEKYYNTSVGYQNLNNNTQCTRSSTLGAFSGYSNAGSYSTYLGYKAAFDGGNFDNTIVINSNNDPLNPTQSNSFFVKPIRNAIGVTNALFYDSSSGEITYDIAGGGATGIVATNNLISKLDTATSLTTGTRNIILGDLAGKSISTQKDNVFIGHQAGFNATINRGVAIGFEAGENGMGTSSICIGQAAGRNNAGNYSINIGFGAGNNGGNHSGCIVIVGGATTLDPNGANRCFMKPIRGVAHGLGVGIPFYDTTTSELSVSSTDITKFHAEFNTDPTDITTSGSTIVFDSTIYNTNSGYNTGTGVFTVPVNGFYRFECFYQLSSNDAITLNWEVNGLINKTDEVYNAYGGSTYRSFTTSWAGILATGDTIELAVFAITGTLRFSKGAKNGMTGYYIGK